jgi:ATP-dependent DNA helicase DinG
MPNVSVPLIPLPPLASTATNISDSYRSLVAHALHVQAPLEIVETSGLPRKSLFIPPSLHAKIGATGIAQSLSFQDTFARLCAAGLSLQVARNDDYQSKKVAVAAPPFAGASPEQVQIYRSIMASLENGRICMAEGSTGVGKSRALIMAALKMAEKKAVETVVVAAPTLAILGHLWSELEALRKEGIGLKVKSGFFPGVGEFVDVERLADYLAVAELHDVAVENWMNEGGTCLQNTPLMRAMADAGVKLHHMMDDLKQIATQLSAQDFMLKSGEDDKRAVDARKAAAQSRIIFCTHTMLGRAHQSQWSLFGSPDVLIIDEGHLFEQNIASIHSDTLSLQMLRFRLREYQQSFGAGQRSVSGRAAEAADDLLAAAMRMIDAGDGRQKRLEKDGAATLIDPVKAMLDTLKSRVFVDFEGIEKIRMALGMVAGVLDGKAHACYLSCSPDRRFPSLTIGRHSVGPVLGDIWKSATHGAVIASATLYLPDSFGNQKCDYMAGILSVPRSRLDTLMPVVAPWVRDIPILHYPDPSAAIQLARPVSQNREEKSEKNWLRNIAVTIRHILDQKSEGGTLVLTTSYAQVAALAGTLEEFGVDADRIVSQQPNVRFSVSEAAYRELHRAGRCPILLGLGAAWTGVDLTDKSAGRTDDRLLTTLVIACTPIGANRTSTMLSRIDRTHLAPLVSESLMMLRQGLGRPVRSPDMRGIDIWMLDGRPWVDWPGMAGWQASVKSILNCYPHRQAFLPITTADWPFLGRIK